MKTKKGVSNVIGAVMLIIMVVVLFVIVLVWSKNILRDKVITIDGENADYVCERVAFRVNYDNSGEAEQKVYLIVSNEGNIDIEDFLVKKIAPGEEENFVLGEGLNSGKALSKNIYDNLLRNYEDPDYDDFTELKVIPILLGAADSGEREYICRESNGQEVLLS